MLTDSEKQVIDDQQAACARETTKKKGGSGPRRGKASLRAEVRELALESLDDENIRKLSNAELNALEAEGEAKTAEEEEANGTKRGKSGTS